MTNEERDIITQFMSRVGGQPAQPPGQSGFGGSVPATMPAPNLPPVDPEADRFIAEQFAQHPEARYRITQMAFVQEAALAEAQNRIKRLQWELDQARQQAPQQAQPQPQQSRGLFGGLFGGGSAQPQQPQAGYPQQQAGYPPQQQYAPPSPPQQPYGAPPPPQYPPQYQPGMFQRAGGSGFLGSALTTAAGVAGGVVVGNALMDMFSGHRGEGGLGGGGFGGGGFGQAPTNETIINNYGDQGAGAGAADPWGGQGAVPGADWANQPGPADQGGSPWDTNATPPDPGFDTSGNADFGGSDPGWQDQGGGFDDDQNV